MNIDTDKYLTVFKACWNLFKDLPQETEPKDSGSYFAKKLACAFIDEAARGGNLTEESQRKCYAAFNDAWKFFKQFSTRPAELDNEDFWAECVKESNILAEKHGKTQFAKDIILTTLDEMDRISRGKPYETSSEVREEREIT